RAFGGMVSFTLHGGEAAAVELCSRTRLFTLAESLGAVESLIEHPARMTHASTSGTSNEVPGDLVRLSGGLETIDVFWHDSETAGGRDPPRPLFHGVGERTIWVGPVGAGSRLKLTANAWLALAAEAVNT